jgi:hypothetical protein
LFTNAVFFSIILVFDLFLVTLLGVRDFHSIDLFIDFYFRGVFILDDFTGVFFRGDFFLDFNGVFLRGDFTGVFLRGDLFLDFSGVFLREDFLGDFLPFFDLLGVFLIDSISSLSVTILELISFFVILILVGNFTLNFSFLA